METYSQNGTFTVSNDACPIEKVELVDGADFFDLTNNKESFMVFLNNASYMKIGNYDYELKATAEGGAINKVKSA